MCHSDIVVVKQEFPLPLPLVLGHEGAGIVAQVGAGVTHVAPGDPVVLSFDSCGHCPTCADAHPAYCGDFMPLNFAGTRLDGTPISGGATDVKGGFFYQSSFATFALAHARNVVKVRADAPLDLLGPLGCGVQTGAGAVLNVLKPKPGSSFCLFGAGAVGALLSARCDQRSDAGFGERRDRQADHPGGGRVNDSFLPSTPSSVHSGISTSCASWASRTRTIICPGSRAGPGSRSPAAAACRPARSSRRWTRCRRRWATPSPRSSPRAVPRRPTISSRFSSPRAKATTN